LALMMPSEPEPAITGSIDSVFETWRSTWRSIEVHSVSASSPVLIRVSFEPGQPRPLHAGASAKIVMAHLPPDVLEKILGRGRLQHLTSRTITDARRLRADLARIRRPGWAVTTGEVDEGVRGIAVPLRDPGGPPWPASAWPARPSG